MRTTAARYIDATEETTAKLAKTFQCTPKFVYLALTYRSDTEKARKIRFTAVENYGATPMCHYPECETLHDTTEDHRQIMRQVFNNGATLRVDKRTGEAWITNRKGETVVHKQVISFPQLSAIQVLAENL
jgi:hypothetical protein